MAKRSAMRTGGLLLCAAALAACGGGESSTETAVLRAKLDSQASEIEALRKASKDADARVRLLEERLSAAAPAPAAAAGAPSAPKKPGAPAAAAAPAAPEGAAPSPTAEAVASYLETEEGRLRIREAMQAEEKRRAEVAEKEQHDRMVGFIKERVSGPLAEQLGLDSNQQQTLITVATDAMDRMSEIWRGMRDARGDAAFLSQAREKSQEVRQQAMDKVQQALTVEQYNKFQELMNDGGAGGLLFGGGGGGRGTGGFGGQGGGAGGAGGAGGGPPRGR